MSDSILKSVKKNLGLPEDPTPFDSDITLFINGVFSTLEQIGVGPTGGYSITDDSDTWDAFLGADARLNSVKTYIYLRVRMLWDPPQTSYLLNALKEQIKELEWRLNVHMEETIWVDPNPDPLDDDNMVVVLDGGVV